jgi:hypothetical protein
MEVLTAAILGPAQRRVNATVGDLPSGQADFSQAALERFRFDPQSVAHPERSLFEQFTACRKGFSGISEHRI